MQFRLDLGAVIIALLIHSVINALMIKWLVAEVSELNRSISELLKYSIRAEERDRVKGG